jgi:sulfopropanediol 3-dehydrogenase
MLRRIEREGMDAVRDYSRELDGWAPRDFAVSQAEINRASASLTDDLKAAIAFAQEQVRGFALAQRRTLVDFETETLPGVFLGQRQVPIGCVGAYVPAGRVPMLAAPFMTVLVAKVAGVERVVSCSPPREGQGIHSPVLHSIATSGADVIYCLGGVQALAAMAFGLLEASPVDMLVGPGNAFVSEAKRQLFGHVESTCSPGLRRSRSWRITPPIPSSSPRTYSLRRSTVPHRPRCSSRRPVSWPAR